MATLEDIDISARINILNAVVFFIIFAVLRLQLFNDRVYLPQGGKSSTSRSGAFVQRFMNLDLKSMSSS